MEPKYEPQKGTTMEPMGIPQHYDFPEALGSVSFLFQVLWPLDWGLWPCRSAPFIDSPSQKVPSWVIHKVT